MLQKMFALALLAGTLIAAPARGASPPPAPTVTDNRYEVKVTPEMRRHSRIEDTLYFAGTAYGFVVLAFVLLSGLSRRMGELARRMTRRKFVAAMIYAALFTCLTSALQFPLDYYGGFVVPHDFGLSSQSFGSWLTDFGKEFAVGLIVGALLLALALLAIRKFRRWWIPLWIGAMAVSLLAIVLIPVVLDPLFNKFVPLRDTALRQALVDEASRAGIEGGRVYEVDKSKQTHEMNAYVTGLGPTNRIVLWDTLLAKLDRDEILAVMGHEMGHFVLHHIWIGFGWSVLISLPVCFLLQQAHERGVKRWGSRWGAASNDDPVALPWLLIVVSAVTFLLSPVINGISRHTEHQADVFGLELTHKNDAMARSFVAFAEDSKVDPTPNRFIEFWRYTHPSLTRRIEFVRNYKPWERGEPNQLWRPGR